MSRSKNHLLKYFSKLTAGMNTFIYLQIIYILKEDGLYKIFIHKTEISNFYFIWYGLDLMYKGVITMKQSFIGKRIRMYLNSNHGFTTLTGILMSIEDNFFVVDTYKGIEYINIMFIVSFTEESRGE